MVKLTSGDVELMFWLPIESPLSWVNEVVGSCFSLEKMQRSDKPGAPPTEEAPGMQMSRLSCDGMTVDPVDPLAVETQQSNARIRSDADPRACSCETPRDGPRKRQAATQEQMVTTSHGSMSCRCRAGATVSTLRWSQWGERGFTIMVAGVEAALAARACSAVRSA